MAVAFSYSAFNSIINFAGRAFECGKPSPGKFAKLVPAISLYLGYFILLNAAKFAVEDGKIPPSIGLWWIHLSALFIGGLLIIRGRPLGAWLKAVVTKREQNL